MPWFCTIQRLASLTKGLRMAAAMSKWLKQPNSVADVVQQRADHILLVAPVLERAGVAVCSECW